MRKNREMKKSEKLCVQETDGVTDEDNVPPTASRDNWPRGGEGGDSKTETCEGGHRCEREGQSKRTNQLAQVLGGSEREGSRGGR